MRRSSFLKIRKPRGNPYEIVDSYNRIILEETIQTKEEAKEKLREWKKDNRFYGWVQISHQKN